MIKHKPTPKTNVIIDGVEYKCKHTGILELPKAYKQFNPIEEEDIIITEVKECKKKQSKQSKQEA